MDDRSRADSLHPDLRRDHGCSVYGAVLIFGLPGLAALAAAVHTALGPLPTRERLGNTLVSGSVGCVLLMGWFLLGALGARWYRRCSRVYYGRRAIEMRVHTIRNDRGGLFLELHTLGDGRMNEPRIRIQAQTPTWDTSDLDGRIVRVHLDDDPEGPVVVETERGRIWPAPFSRRQNRVEGRLG